jgi:glycosyltransferase involved in cell wall biosynthesis
LFSLCLIVKNEEKFIGGCLKSAAGFTSDIVVIDTGSADRTKEIAASFNARVFDFTWIADFAAARNFAASKSKYDWILALDADEVITFFGAHSIKEFMQNPLCVGRIEISSPGAGEIAFSERITRFYNKQNYYFTGKIHELVTPKKKGAQVYFRDIPLKVDHFGYTPEVLEKTGKLERNRVMIERELEGDRDNPYYLYQLGKVYFARHNPEKAAEFFERSLAQKPNPNLAYVYSLVECYGYALLEMELYQKSTAVFDFYGYYKHIPNFLFLLAHICQNNGKLVEAVDFYEKVIETEKKGEDAGLSPVANYNIGVIFEIAGMTDDAREFYVLAGNYANAVKRLELLNGGKQG